MRAAALLTAGTWLVVGGATDCYSGGNPSDHTSGQPSLTIAIVAVFELRSEFSGKIEQEDESGSLRLPGRAFTSSAVRSCLYSRFGGSDSDLVMGYRYLVIGSRREPHVVVTPEEEGFCFQATGDSKGSNLVLCVTRGPRKWGHGFRGHLPKDRFCFVGCRLGTKPYLIAVYAEALRVEDKEMPGRMEGLQRRFLSDVKAGGSAGLLVMSAGAVDSAARECLADTAR